MSWYGSFNFSSTIYLLVIPTSIPLFCEFVSKTLVRIRSSREEVEHVIQEGYLIISVNENVWQKCFFTKAEIEFLRSCH